MLCLQEDDALFMINACDHQETVIIGNSRHFIILVNCQLALNFGPGSWRRRSSKGTKLIVSWNKLGDAIARYRHFRHNYALGKVARGRT